MKKHIFLLAALSIITMYAADQGKLSLYQPVEIIIAPTTQPGVTTVKFDSSLWQRTPYEIHTELSKWCNTTQGVLCIVSEKQGICNIRALPNLLK